MNQLEGDSIWTARSITIIDPVSGHTVRTPEYLTYQINGAREEPNDNNLSLGITTMSTHQQIMATTAFQLWDDLIATSFRHTHDGNPNISFNYSNTFMTNPHNSEYAVGTHSIGSADVWIPTSVTRTDKAGVTTTYNYADDSKLTFGSHFFSTDIHEIGHALGLEHPGNYNGEGAPDDHNDPAVLFAQDTIQYTVMSYYGPRHYEAGGANWYVDGTMNSTLIEPQTPMLYDVAAIQKMYGADMHTRDGDTVYGFHSNLGSGGTADIYNFNINKLPVMTIYDAGGNDTLDVSGYSMSQSIDLRAGAFSSVGGLKNNIAMAYNETSGPNGNANFNPKAVIENAVGGSGADSMWGNSADNVLKGGAGADTIYGLDGNDTLDGGTGADSLHGGRGNDTYIVDNTGDTVSEIDFVSGSWKPNPMIPWQMEFVPVYGDMGGVDEVKASIAKFSLADAQYVENLTYTGGGNFTGIGNDLDNVITGGANSDMLIGGKGNDTLYGGAGFDTLEGGEGRDALYGGAGADILKGGADDDTYWYVEKQDMVLESAGGGRDRVVTQESGYRLAANVEELQVGNQNTDGVMTGYGNNLDNYIGAWDVHAGPNGAGFEFYGLDGNDTLGGGNAALGDLLDGGKGDDNLYGNGGDDTLRGGEGADFLFGGEGFDTADYSQATAGVVVDLVSGGKGGEALGDTYNTVEAVKGSNFADNISGTDNADTFTGLGGNDTIDGRGGDDTVVLSGKRADYKITVSGQTATLVDLRAGSPDGTDTATNIEHFRFADQTVDFLKLGNPGSVSIGDVTVTEGDNGSQLATFTVTRTGGSAAFDVNFATSNGTATTADGDYVAKSGSLHFNEGVDKQTISIEIKGDTKVEANETFNVNLSGASNGATIADATGVGTITNNDVAAPKIATPVADDFGGDGKTDILFQNKNGTVALWQMDGNKIASNTTVGSTSTNWHIEGTDDFGGDGKTDILWRNDSGTVAMWQMNGDKIASNTTVGSAGKEWHIAGVDDFGGDGKADVLWTSDSGKVAMWQLDGDKIASNTTVGTIGKGWHVEATADFNGDGKADLLLQNGNQVAMWEMNGDKVTSVKTFGTVGDGFHFAAAGDLNSDGKSDIVWESDSGQVMVWQMDGSRIASNQIAGTAPAGWDVATIGDYNHDGHADVLLKSNAGQFAMMQTDGSHVTSFQNVGSVSTDWHMMA
jgi:Ca2+-binding RTX toxin-like protein